MREEVIFAIVQMLEAGIKQEDVAARFNLSKSAVFKIFKKCRSNTRKITKKRGRVFKLNAASLRILQRILPKNNKKGLHISVAEFREYYGYKLYIKTVRRYLHRSGLRNYAAVSKPYSCFRHIVARKQWANMHKEWDTTKWGNVALSDESTFTIKPTALRKRIWRKQGERYRTVNFVPTFKSGFQFISVWAAFSVKGRTFLLHIDGILNQHKYISILDDYLLSFAGTYHGGTTDFIFQQGNC